MPRFRTSPTEADLYPSMILLGRIINVKYDTFCVDVMVDSTGSVYNDVQIGCPYFHPYEGEGIYVMPEVNCQCVIGIPSDHTDPFVICFLGAVEDKTKGELQGSQTSGEIQKGLEDEEKDLEELQMSYRNSRPLLRPGDIYMKTRDGNFLTLRRGGVVQIGATAIAQRMYVPIRNFIRDFAENYSMDTAGGRMSWELVHEDDNHNAAVQKFIWREYAEHSKASVMCSIGQVGDNYLDFTMAPEAIDSSTGEIKGDTVLTIRFSKKGERIEECTKQTITVNGDRKIIITGKHEEECNSYSQKVKGERRVEFENEYKKGTKSVESLERKDIKAQLITLAGGSYSVPRGDLLLQWLETHTHPATSVAGVITVSPPIPPPAGLLCEKVKVG